jgi:hypothetical protein
VEWGEEATKGKGLVLNDLGIQKIEFRTRVEETAQRST